jgi:hypothetical protein
MLTAVMETPTHTNQWKTSRSNSYVEEYSWNLNLSSNRLFNLSVCHEYSHVLDKTLFRNSLHFYFCGTFSSHIFNQTVIFEDSVQKYSILLLNKILITTNTGINLSIPSYSNCVFSCFLESIDSFLLLTLTDVIDLLTDFIAPFPFA